MKQRATWLRRGRQLAAALLAAAVTAGCCVPSALAAAPSAANNDTGKSWAFTYFGPSTSEAINTVSAPDGIGGSIVMTSCSANDDGTINKKGGKFVSSDPADGISLYYTTIDPSKENFYLQADVTIDYSGFLGAMEASVEALSIGGTAVWVGGVCPQDKVRLDSEQVIRRLSTIRGLHNYNTDDFRTAVDFIVKHHRTYPFTKLLHDGFTLERAEDAFQYAIRHNPYRVGIRINPTTPA